MSYFPNFYLPDVDDTQKWGKEIIDSIDRYYDGNYEEERRKDWDNYNLFSGEADAKEFEYLTNTFGVTSPARYVNYPLIKPKINHLVGEFLSQPLKFSVQILNEEAVNRKEDKKITLMARELTRPYREEIEKITGIEIDPDEIQMEVPQHIDDFSDEKFREPNEEIVFFGLRYLKRKYNLLDEFKRGFYDMCIASKEFYKVDIINGDPQARRVDPRRLIYDLDTDEESLEDHEWIAEEREIGASRVVEEYREWLDESQIRKIDELRSMTYSKFREQYGDVRTERYYNFNERGSNDIRVVHCEWKAIRNIKVIREENPLDPASPFIEVVDDDYEPKEGETVEEFPVQDVWEGAKIGHDMYVGIRRKPNQVRKESIGYSNTKLSYKGVIAGNFINKTLSVVDSLKNIQLFYNLTMFHIELALSRSAGKSVVYDVSMKPEGYSMKDVVYHMKNHGIIAVNSMQEGGKIRSPFNQFQQVDFTLSRAVSQLINLKLVLERTADKLTGLSPERQGFTKDDQLVGVQEQSIIQSTLVTKPLFRAHTRVVNDVLQHLADYMKIAWHGEEDISMILGEEGYKYFQLDDNFHLQDFGVFVENSFDEAEKLDQLINLSQAAMSSGQIGIQEAVSIINAETSEDAEDIINESARSMQEIQKKAQQQKLRNEEMENKLKQQEIKKDYDIAKIEAQTTLQEAKLKSQADLKEKKMDIRGDLQQEDMKRKSKLDRLAMDIHHGGEDDAERQTTLEGETEEEGD